MWYIDKWYIDKLYIDKRYMAKIVHLVEQQTFMLEVLGSIPLDSWLNLAEGWLNPPSLCA